MKCSRFPARILLLVLLLTFMAAPVHADITPKPSVTVSFTGLEGRECYATLLSQDWRTGPHSSIWKINPYGERYLDPGFTPEYSEDASEYPAFRAFLEYEEQDPDGLFFLNYFTPVSDEAPFYWGYYPPDPFKILLYFPETDCFAVTDELLNRYAFDSQFVADLSGMELSPGEICTGLSVKKDYRITGELTGFAVRASLTAAIELALAGFLFQLNTRRQLALILLTNLATQAVLNLILSWYAHQHGPASFEIVYLIAELAVLLAEYAIYRAWMPELPSEQRNRHLWRYTLTANLISFLTGILLAGSLPSFF